MFEVFEDKFGIDKACFHLQFLHDLSGQDEADRPAVPRSAQQRKYLGKAHLREALLMHEEALRVNRWIGNSAVKRSIGSTTGCTITEKAPTRAFSWLKAPTSAFTFKTLLRHYAKRAARSL